MSMQQTQQSKQKINLEHRSSKIKSQMKQKRLQLLDGIFHDNFQFQEQKNEEQQSNKEQVKNSETILKDIVQLDKEYITSQHIQQFINILPSVQPTKEKNYAIQFCLKYNLLIPPNCEKCGDKMKLGFSKRMIGSHGWRCYYEQCDKNLVSLYNQHPLFSRFRIELDRLLKIYLQLVPTLMSTLSINQQFKLNDHQLATCRKRWQQQIIIEYQYNYYQNIQFGQNGEVIEIDESHFKRKHNKGRLIKRDQWVLGITERGDGFDRLVLIPVENRKANTLLPLIELFVSKNCTLICTDAWKSYNGLSQLGYSHKVVNHSKNFIKPSENFQSQKKFDLFYGHLIHTQSIESKWKHVKERLRQCRGKRVNYLSDIYTSIFYLSYKNNIEINSLRAISQYMSNQSNSSTEMEIENETNIETKQQLENEGDDNISDQSEPESDADDDDNLVNDRAISKQFKQKFQKNKSYC